MGITIDHFELQTDARLDAPAARRLVRDIGHALDQQWRAGGYPGVRLASLRLNLAASELARPGVAGRVAQAALARIGAQTGDG